MNANDIKETAERFNISKDEAERIAETVETEAEFIRVWENTEWWTDKNNPF